MKKTWILLILALLIVGTIAMVAAEVQASPEMDAYKKAVEKANTGFWDWLFGTQAIVGSPSWNTCEKTCSSFFFTGDCSPCQSGEIESNCIWSGDSMSSYPGWSSANAYCNDWLAQYNYYNKQCLCTVPQPECSGGADPGDKKCSSGDVWECNSNGVWEIYNTCDYTCDDKQCQGECSTDSDCGDNGYVGSVYCSSNNVYQKYRTYDCSGYNCDYTESESLVEQCTTGENCVNGACVSSCTPKTCSQLGFECGMQDDECGNQINCGSCLGTENCVLGICKLEDCTPNCIGKKCGSNGCDGTCGTCDSGETCDNGLCLATADCNSNSECKTLAEVVCDDETLWYKSYSCVSGQCNIGLETPPESCVSIKQGANYFLQIAIGVISVFVIGTIGFVIYKRKK